MHSRREDLDYIARAWKVGLALEHLGMSGNAVFNVCHVAWRKMNTSYEKLFDVEGMSNANIPPK